MQVLDHFSIPYQGLKNGVHSIKFEIDDSFFLEFENSLLTTGSFQVELMLDKKPSMAIAEFQIVGKYLTNCDRCLADLELDMDEYFLLHIKVGEEEATTDEVIFIDAEEPSINFAQYIYESIILSIPMIKTHEDVEDCDQEVVGKLKDFSDPSDESNIWDSLKNLDLE